MRQPGARELDWQELLKRYWNERKFAWNNFGKGALGTHDAQYTSHYPRVWYPNHGTHMCSAGKEKFRASTSNYQIFTGAFNELFLAVFTYFLVIRHINYLYCDSLFAHKQNEKRLTWQQWGPQHKLPGPLTKVNGKHVVENGSFSFCGWNFARGQMGNTQGRSPEGKGSVRPVVSVEKRPNILEIQVWHC